MRAFWRSDVRQCGNSGFLCSLRGKSPFSQFPVRTGRTEGGAYPSTQDVLHPAGEKLNVLRKHNAGTMVRQKADANFPHWLFGWQNSRYVQVFQGSQPFAAQEITGAALGRK